MPRHQLNPGSCKSAVKGDHGDGGGLILRVEESGTKRWVYRYQINKKRTSMGLGSYPAVSLQAARKLHQEYEALVKQKIDPQRVRAQSFRKGASLSDVVEEFFETKQDVLKTGQSWLSPFQHILPKLGKKPVDDITSEDIVNTLSPIWKSKYPTAVRALNRLDQVLKYAAGQGDWDVDITATIRAKARLGMVKHVAVGHKALPWRDIPKLWVELGNEVTQRALKFYLLTVVRVANVTYADWSEFDDRLTTWSLPAERMKAERAFQVPLSRQARALIKPRGTGLVFPSNSARVRGVVSENTWNKLFQSKGFNTTAHGLRSTFRDWCAETGACSDTLAELCLQHETAKGNKVARAYFRSGLLDDRRSIMQAWADFVTSDEKALLDKRNKAREFQAALDEPVELPRNGVSRTSREIDAWGRYDGLEGES